MVEFGQRLLELRTQKNLTQIQLAKRVGVQNSIISFYETGERRPSVEMVRRLSREFQVSADYLLGLEKKQSVDISGLTENDKKLICELVDSLSEKNRLLK